MSFTADDYRKAADVVESVYPGNNGNVIGLRARAERMDAEAAEEAELDRQVVNLFNFIKADDDEHGVYALDEINLRRAHSIISYGWKRIEE